MPAIPVARITDSTGDESVEWVSCPTRGTPLKVRVIGRDRTAATIQLAGEMDTVTAGAVGQVLRGQIERGRRLVELDVSGLTFCDCAGLGEIVRAHNALSALRGTLVLTGASARLAQLLQITHLDEEIATDHRDDSQVRRLRQVTVRRC